jgi:hypothetical protein
MTTEALEHTATVKALKQINDWLSPGTNEGASWSLSRLTEDLFGDSFLAGGDATRITPGTPRGTIHSQLSNALFVMNAPGPSNIVERVPISMVFDLNHGHVTLNWTPPGGAATTVNFTVELDKRFNTPTSSGELLFHADGGGGTAGFQLLIMLL